jgi:hypothetical protein
MLKQKIQTLSSGFELWDLSSPLPCCQILETGQVCLRDARYALVNPKRADEYVVYPYCDEHLPTKVSLPQVKGAAQNGEGNQRIRRNL